MNTFDRFFLKRIHGWWTIGDSTKTDGRDAAMRLEIKESRDVAILTRMNEFVQKLHVREYSHYFKPFNYQEVYQSMQEALAKENWHAYVAFAEDQPAGFVPDTNLSLP